MAKDNEIGGDVITATEPDPKNLLQGIDSAVSLLMRVMEQGTFEEGLQAAQITLNFAIAVGFTDNDED